MAAARTLDQLLSHHVALRGVVASSETTIGELVGECQRLVEARDALQAELEKAKVEVEALRTALLAAKSDAEALRHLFAEGLSVQAAEIVHPNGTAS